jgi:hypothetical protein
MIKLFRFFVPFTLSVIAEFFLVSYDNNFEVAITPVAEAQTTCDTGVSDAPCRPANTRIIVVNPNVNCTTQCNPAPNGEFKHLRSALNTMKAGDTFQLKPGTYNCVGDPACVGQNAGGLYTPWLATRAGTRTQPITIQPYPGSPKWSVIFTAPLTINQPWMIIEGIKFQNMTDTGLILYKINPPNQAASNITVRNNWFYYNNNGIFTYGATEVLFEDNIFERNGLGPDDCMHYVRVYNTPLDQRYGHCHGMYLNNSDGNNSLPYPYEHFTIRRNLFLGNTGNSYGSRADANYIYDKDTGALLFKSGYRADGWLVENNLIVNQSFGIGFIDMVNSTIRNNTTVQFTFPTPSALHKTCWYANHVHGNTLANNVCYMTTDPTKTSVKPIHAWNYDATFGNNWTHNAWFVVPGSQLGWPYNSAIAVLTEFLTTYKTKTGDTNGIVVPITPTSNGSEAGWVNALPNPANLRSSEQGDYHLLPSSPLRDAGDPTNCPSTDLDGNRRTDGKCDIGAFEFGATGGGGTSSTPTPTPTPAPTPGSGQLAVTLSASPITVSPGASISVNWNVTSGVPAQGDWIGFYKSSDPNNVYLSYTDVLSRANGTYTVTAPNTPGTYDFRYLIWGTSNSLAKSGTITVVGGTSAGQCALYTSSSAIPTGFASPYDVVNNPNQSMMNASCSTNGTQPISLGNGSQLTYIYKTGYVLRNNTWQQVNYTGSNLLYSNWYVGNATGALNLSQAELSQGTYFVSYQCQWIASTGSGQAGGWKCGCRTAACTGTDGNRWQIQFIKQ